MGSSEVIWRDRGSFGDDWLDLFEDGAELALDERRKEKRVEVDAGGALWIEPRGEEKAAEYEDINGCGLD